MHGTVMFVELCCVSISRGGDDMSGRVLTLNGKFVTIINRV